MKYYKTLALSSIILLSNGQAFSQKNTLVAKQAVAKKTADIKKYVETKLLDDSVYIAKPFKADSLVLKYGLKQKPLAAQNFTVADIDNVLVVLKSPGGQNISVNFSNPGDEESELDHYFWPANLKQKITEKYGADAWGALLANTLKVGWNKELCKLCWGDPHEIKTSRTPAGVKEQWIFDNGAKLFFTNGKLVTIQDK